MLCTDHLLHSAASDESCAIGSTIPSDTIHDMFIVGFDAGAVDDVKSGVTFIQEEIRIACCSVVSALWSLVVSIAVE